jgi:CheY-like chemotaxis protein
MNTILVVEDNESVRKALTTLTKCLFPTTKLVFAVTADEGIKAIKSDMPFDMALVDKDIPVENSGFEVIKALKEKRPGTPVIFMTGGCKDEEELGQIANEHGADAFFLKPFPLDKFRKAIDQASAKIPVAS